MALRITEKAELVALARTLGMRKDWHEPDEQGVTAIVMGHHFDNAGFWPEPGYTGHRELYVLIMQDGEEVATVNLATLLAWATGLED